MMFSKEEIEKEKITDIGKFLGRSGNRAVGESQTFSILPTISTYTDTTSIETEMYYNISLNQSPVSQLKTESEGAIMDDNKLLEMYMEKVDKDQRDLKDDMRESEKRTEKRIEISEKRLDEHMARIVDIIEEQNKKFEKIDGKLEKVSTDVSTGLNEYRKFMWGIAVSIFLAAIAIVASVYI